VLVIVPELDRVERERLLGRLDPGKPWPLYTSLHVNEYNSSISGVVKDGPEGST
jgi:hypothetical protein